MLDSSADVYCGGDSNKGMVRDMSHKKNNKPRVWETLAELTQGLTGAAPGRNYTYSDISSHFWINGHPPESGLFRQLARHSFSDWSFGVSGLVGSPLHLSLEDLRELPRRSHVITQSSKYTWLGSGTWTGVPLVEVLKRCEALPEAKYVVLSSYQLQQSGLPYDKVIDITLATHPLTILAYEVNGSPLSIEQGAPLRLQVEMPSGFKIVKYLRSIELVRTIL
jgi:methionine sulfoxide reductase catalytic subunit